MTYKKIITIPVFLLIFFAFVARAAPELPAGYMALSISKNIPRGGEARLDIPFGLYCGAGCAKLMHPYRSGMPVNITIAVSPGYSFIGWSGDCSGVDLTCALVMDGNKNVIANFASVGAGAANTVPAPIKKTPEPSAPRAIIDTITSTPTVSESNISSFSNWRWLVFAIIPILAVIFIIFYIRKKRRDYY